MKVALFRRTQQNPCNAPPGASARKNADEFTDSKEENDDGDGDYNDHGDHDDGDDDDDDNVDDCDGDSHYDGIRYYNHHVNGGRKQRRKTGKKVDIKEKVKTRKEKSYVEAWSA